MNELEKLNIVDDRTIEQVRADGDERWPDGRPYIKGGVCCICGTNVAAELEQGYSVHVCLVKMEKPVPCSTALSLYDGTHCTGTAYWESGASKDEMSAMCDKDLMAMLEILPNIRAWFEPALADIRGRCLCIGARVRIQAEGIMQGKLGTVCYYADGRPAPWHVRPDGWGENETGIAYKAAELDVLL